MAPRRTASTTTIQPNSDGSITIPVAPEGGDDRTYSAVEFEAALAAARQEEKDKLYGRIDEVNGRYDALEKANQQMQTQFEQLNAEREARERTSAESASAAAEAQRQAELADMSVGERLAAVQKDWQEQMTNRDHEWAERMGSMQQEIAKRDALLEQERNYQVVSEYRLAQIEANRDVILPQLQARITGSSVEEIDAAIASFRSDTESILSDMRAATEQAPSQLTPGVRVTAPSAPSLENYSQATETFTPERIAAMSPQEYAKHRPQLLRAARPGGVPQY